MNVDRVVTAQQKHQGAFWIRRRLQNPRCMPRWRRIS